MSDLENADEVKPLDFNTIFDLEESTPGGTSSEDEEGRIAWQSIKRTEWSVIEARYNAGNRDKETVCLWMAREAALHLRKQWPQRRGPLGNNDGLDELIAEGYEYAIERWPEYDPTKATKNGISGFIYKTARGHMRNAAHELFTAHGKRKHDKDDVLPVVFVAPDTARIKGDGENSRRYVTGSSDAEDTFSRAAEANGIDPDIGSLKDKAINAAADRAARSKSNAVLKWTRQPKVPQSRAAEPEYQSREAREATEIEVQRLIAPYPPKEREVLSFAWGLDGVEKETPQQLAIRWGCTVSTVYKRLGKMYVEIAAREAAAERRAA
jgi:RNA polymerase sigma factor (sigma-70 family)